MNSQEIGILIMDFFVLQIKIITLLFWEIYNRFFGEKKNVKGEIVLVTGAGGSLGRELSIQLAKEGARLVLWDVNNEENQHTGRIVEQMGAEVHCFTCDVSDYKSVLNTANKVRKAVGNPTYVFNNAGECCEKPFLDHSQEEIEIMVDVNILGNIWVTKEFLGPMINSNKGHIVCFSSILGYVGRANLVPYCTSKWGVKGLTEALAEEIRMERRFGITITAVHPFVLSNVQNKFESRLPSVFKILSPEEAAAKIVNGVLRNEEEIFVPEILKPLVVLSRSLPRSTRRAIMDYIET